jgi:EAL domain-containing protein (putative c-di-GMP-specific phosphodiesterase class I)
MPHPGALFDAAERLNQTITLGRAIRRAVPGPMMTSDALLFANLSTIELADDALYAEDSPLLPLAHRTVLEITERASLDSVKNVRERIAALRRMGFRIALDDIGAGYAGLSSFAVLEPDVVKLDMSLVRDVQSSPTKQKLIRSMTALCQGMGILVIAEGVESRQELDVLLDLGCDHFQGYYFARPARPFPAVSWGDAIAA